LGGNFTNTIKGGIMSEPLIPSEEWVAYPDSNPENDDDPCPACSALVENRAVHRAWHLAIFDLAKSYVSPPLYGGSNVRFVPSTSPGNIMPNKGDHVGWEEINE
jgi:hypothetical protein